MSITINRIIIIRKLQATPPIIANITEGGMAEIGVVERGGAEIDVVEGGGAEIGVVEGGGAELGMVEGGVTGVGVVEGGVAEVVDNTSNSLLVCVTIMLVLAGHSIQFTIYKTYRYKHTVMSILIVLITNIITYQKQTSVVHLLL